MQLSESMNPKRRRIILLVLAALLLALIVLAARGVFAAGGRSVSAVKLRCMATQDVTPFGDEILYYDGLTLYCLRSNGSEHWSYPLGENASFTCSDTVVTAWSGTLLHIIDRNGNATYNENLSDVIQFARVGKKYVAVVLGGDISPSLMIKDMQGTTVDNEATAYKDMTLLDLGFFSDGEYLWTTSLDVYGSVPDTTLHTFRVNVSNSGGISLGDHLVYAVIYAGKQLNVVSTQQLRKYDYRGTIDNSGTVLVYGWQLIDHEVSNSEAMLLFTPSRTAGLNGGINQLRLVWGKTDKQYSLPTLCISAALYGRRIYAFSEDMVYRAELSARRFDPISLSGVLNGQPVTEYLGMLKNGVALLACESDVYALILQ
ncbi:MAG: hypothetical protein IKN04_01325 [Clostridia bacterium]|nr:hypothetical protein [Clostridia bacterium]